jgi:hypothetical protein
MYVIQHCFICRPWDSTVSKDAGIEARTVATLALTARRSKHSTRSHPQILIIILDSSVQIRIRIRIHRIPMFLGLLDTDPSIIKQKLSENP